MKVFDLSQIERCCCHHLKDKFVFVYNTLNEYEYSTNE